VPQLARDGSSRERSWFREGGVNLWFAETPSSQ